MKLLSILDKYNYPLDNFTNVKLSRDEKLHVLKNLSNIKFLRIAVQYNKIEHVKLLFGDPRISEEEKLNLFIEILNRKSDEDLIIEIWNLIPININVIYHAIIMYGYRKILTLIINSPVYTLFDISSPLDNIEMCPYLYEFLSLILKDKKFSITCEDIIAALIRISLSFIDDVKVIDLLIQDKRLTRKIPISILINLPKSLKKYFFHHKFLYDPSDFKVVCHTGNVVSLVVYLKLGYLNFENMIEGIKILNEEKHFHNVYLIMQALNHIEKPNKEIYNENFFGPHLSLREYRKLLDLLDPDHPYIENNIEIFLEKKEFFPI